MTPEELHELIKAGEARIAELQASDAALGAQLNANHDERVSILRGLEAAKAGLITRFVAAGDKVAQGSRSFENVGREMDKLPAEPTREERERG